MKASAEGNNDESVALWSLLVKGDRQAFKALYRQYVQVLYHYGRRYTNDDSLIEDAIHDVFCNLWKSREGLCVPISVRFYLYACFRRVLHKILRKKEIMMEDHRSAENYCQADGPVTIEEELVLQEDQLMMKSKLKVSWGKLSVNQRKAVYLKFVKKKTAAEISDEMGLGKEAVYKMIQRAVKEMRSGVLCCVIFLAVTALLCDK